MRGNNAYREIGLIGETEIIKFLKRAYPEFKDVRKDKYYQWRDIDFIAGNTSFELKTDSYPEIKNDKGQYGNFCFELGRDNDLPGCFTRSKADYWLYYFVQSGNCYQFELSRLQTWLMLNLDKCRIDARARAHRNGKYANFVIALAPIELVLKDVPYQKIMLRRDVND